MYLLVILVLITYYKQYLSSSKLHYHRKIMKIKINVCGRNIISWIHPYS